MQVIVPSNCINKEYPALQSPQMFWFKVELYKYDAQPAIYAATSGFVALIAVQVNELLLNTNPLLH